MKRIGICTMYYKNRNYGANLQAYALRKIIDCLGYEAEMVSFYPNTRVHHILSYGKKIIKQKTPLSREIEIRKASVDRFSHSIPHSRLYYSNTINQANSNYDVFIVGSDQVWNPDWITRFTSLDFVEKSKRTIAYAASTGKIHLEGVQEKKLRNALANTEFISIREKESIPALQALTDKRIEYVLDPTMLLLRDDWDAICAERMIPEEYIFCYFLGDNENLRRTALEYARIRRLKIVTFPYLNGTYRSVDDGFGDYALYNISPTEFLSLIRYASFVMTDSFHGTVFSHLYERNFIVSSKRNAEMGCRLKSITEVFGTEHRYINDHEMVSLDRLMAIGNDPMKLKWEEFYTMRQKSLVFLKEAIEKDE